jgi:hypothetical protein
MRLALSLTIMTFPLFAADLKIDHVTIAGARLESMRVAFTAATGIPTEYGGPHANGVTEMALASFPDGSYFELMGIQRQAGPAAVAAHTWGQFLRDDGGPCAFALRVTEVSAETERLKKAGIHVGSAEKSGRTRPDGVRLSWETADIGQGPRGSFFPFLIRDFTPREQRAYPTGKPTSSLVRGIELVVIGVASLDASVAEYRRAFDLPAPKRQRDETFGADLAWFESSPVVLAAALTPNSWLARRIAKYGPAPCAFVFATTLRPSAPEASTWFSHSISWAKHENLDWRLGMDTTQQ